jgi:hypothetical protein
VPWLWVGVIITFRESSSVNYAEACLSTTGDEYEWRLSPRQAMGFAEMAVHRALNLALS